MGGGARTKGTLELSGSSRRPGDKRTFLVMLPPSKPARGRPLPLVLRCCARIYSTVVFRLAGHFAPYPPPS